MNVYWHWKFFILCSLLKKVYKTEDLFLLDFYDWLQGIDIQWRSLLNKKTILVQLNKVIILATKNIHRNLGVGTAGQQDILGTGRQKLDSGDTENAKRSGVTWNYFNCFVFVLQKISGYRIQFKKQCETLINKKETIV